MTYSKCPKISNTLFYTFLVWILLIMQLFLKTHSGMADSVDPDQTAPAGAVWSGSALFAYANWPDTLDYGFLGDFPYMMF